MPTECSADLFGFAPVEGREVVAAFDGGAITSDAGALLLGAADHAIRLTQRFAACFHDTRRRHLIEHELTDRQARRIARYMAESGLPQGKSFATFDFAAVPTIRKAHVIAL